MSSGVWSFSVVTLHPQFFFGVAVLLLRQAPGFHKGQQHGFLIFVKKFAAGSAADRLFVFDSFQSDGIDPA